MVSPCSLTALKVPTLKGWEMPDWSERSGSRIVSPAIEGDGGKCARCEEKSSFQGKNARSNTI